MLNVVVVLEGDPASLEGKEQREVGVDIESDIDRRKPPVCQKTPYQIGATPNPCAENHVFIEPVSADDADDTKGNPEAFLQEQDDIHAVHSNYLWPDLIVVVFSQVQVIGVDYG